ncbi:MAG: hypothetical protein GC161_10760 [Planctomycetaceae bacterium]|nr:hypothetical protein [Planctomycetaceae bacterium]
MEPLATSLLLLTLAAFPAPQFGAPQPQGPVATASAVVEHVSAAPGGTIEVGLRLELPEHWHVYWSNPGDSGLPTSVHWTAPEGFRVSAPHWPAPQRFVTGPLASYGYAKEVLLASTITVPEDWKGGSVKLELRGDWLVCHDDLGCFPESKTFELEVPIAAGPAKPTAAAPYFAAARGATPRALEGGEARLVKHPEGMALRVRFPDAVQQPVPETPPERRSDFDLAAYEPLFFPFESGHLEPSAPQRATVDGRTLELVLVAPLDPRRTEPGTLAGVLVLRPRTPGPLLSFELLAEPPH